MGTQQTGFQGRTIMFATADKACRMAAVSALKSIMPARVFPAENGEQALAHLNNASAGINFAIIDFAMPGLSGLEILKSIRTQKCAVPHDLHVILMTSLTDSKELIGAAFSLDVDALISKPLPADTGERFAKVFSAFRAIKSKLAYEKVNAEEVAKLLLPKPVKSPAEAAAGAAQASGKEAGGQDAAADAGLPMTPLDAVTVGSVLASDIRRQNGELFVAKDTVLSERLLQRLRDQSDALGLRAIAVCPQ
jgi:DNA-binding NarL/FixJ family response regulator